MKAILLVLAVVLCAGFGYAYSSGEPIPAWIKQVAGFWAEDKITDLEFVAALEFLIRQGAIQVDDSERVFELKEENRVLRERIALLESGGTHPGEASGSTASLCARRPARNRRTAGHSERDNSRKCPQKGDCRMGASQPPHGYQGREHDPDPVVCRHPDRACGSRVMHSLWHLRTRNLAGRL